MIMLVTFSSKSYADITMFGDVAVKLLKLMRHSGKVPSALLAKDVPSALALLEAAILEAKQRPEPEPEISADDEDEEAIIVSLPQRAQPLIDLLKAAARDESNVMWSANS